MLTNTDLFLKVPYWVEYDSSGGGLRGLITKLTEEREFPAGEWICRPDMPANGLYFIQEGAVSIADASIAHRGLLLEPGDTFGEYILEALPPEQKAFPSALRALTKVRTRRLLKERYDSERGGLIDLLRAIVVERASLCGFLPRFMDALIAHETFGCLSRSQLLDLALLGKAIPIGPTLNDSFAPYDRVWIARGRISLHYARNPPAEVGAGAFIESFPPGTALSCASKVGAWVIHLDERRVEKLVGASFGMSALRRRKPAAPPPPKASEAAPPNEGTTAPPPALTSDDDKARLIVCLATGQRERAAIGAVASLLADALKYDFPGETIRFSSAKTAREVIADIEQPGLVVLDAHDWQFSDLWPLAQYTTKVVHLSETSFEPAPYSLRERSVVRCVLLDERGRDRPPDFRRSVPWVGPFFGRFFPKDRFDGQVTADPPPAYYPGTVRLLLTKEKKLARFAFRELPQDDRKSLSRLGRAVTNRRIGVALGGGGALGFAHIALLEALEHFEVPIDMISGVSFGSLVAAFYAADGLKGVERLKLQRRRLQAALLVSSMIPPAVEFYLLGALLGTRLEEIPVPFYPVALNLETSEEFTPTIGSMARGIRMSSALPGMLTPYVSPARRVGPKLTLIKDVPKRLVDGATVNNVPEGILVREGADFIIASDVIALPPPPESLFPQVLDLPKFIPAGVDVVEGGLLLAGSVMSAVVGTVWPFARMKDTMRSMSYLTRVADDRDADFANMRFRPALGSFAMWDFGGAEKIMDESRQAAIAFAERTKDAWLKRGTAPDDGDVEAANGA